MKKYRWINMFTYGMTAGYVYFKAYVDNSTDEVVGWVSRSGLPQPYSYSVYWVENGQVQSSTRGAWQHADWAVQGAIDAAQPARGLCRITEGHNKVLAQLRNAMRLAEL